MKQREYNDPFILCMSLFGAVLILVMSFCYLVIYRQNKSWRIEKPYDASERVYKTFSEKAIEARKEGING